MKKSVLFVGIIFLFSACQNGAEVNKKKSQTTKCWDENTVFPFTVDADVYPSYKEGNEALMKFLTEEIKYPVQAKEQGEEGKVYVQFVVRAEGTVNDVKVIRGVSKLLDEESVRVAKLTSGKWTPGLKAGLPINATMTLPIQFKLR